MIQVRINTFETNSSSIHSISIYRIKGSGKISGGIVTSELLKKFSEDGSTELGKLKFCIDLMFSILSTEEVVNDDLKHRIISYFNDALLLNCGSRLDSDIYPDKFSDMYAINHDPDTIFRNFIKEEFGVDMVGSIDSDENLEITLKAIERIIFCENIKTVNNSIL